MELIRGWERRYAPHVTGGLQLSKVRWYRTIGDEDGMGDEGEGEIRVSVPASVTRLGGSDFDDPPMDMSVQMGPDERAIEVEGLMTEERREVREELYVEDSGLNDSPLFSAYQGKPSAKRGWDVLRAALPERYDVWTVTRDVHACSLRSSVGSNGGWR